MATWNNFAVGFDIGEETINFGTRAVALCEDGIYESATLATIQSDDKEHLSSVPQCHAVFSYNAVALACDKSLILFDLGFTTVLFSYHFESPIEIIDLSVDGAFIFCGLVNYTFICLHIPSNGKIIFSKSLWENETFSGTKFFSKIISKCSNENLEVFAFINNGMIVRAFTADVKEIVYAIKNDETVEIPERFNISIMTVRPPTPFRSEVILSTFYTYDGEYFVFLVDENIYLWSLNGDLADILMEGNPYDIKKISHVPSRHILICLCGDGCLLIICLHTLQVIKKWNAEKIKNFVLLENVEYKPVSAILVVTDSEESELCLVEIPALEVKLRLKVSSPSFLVDKQNTTEDVLYIEAFGEEKIDTIRVKAIAESSPDLRLDRLLQRGKFNDAEKFARNLSLSLEEVYKAKVKWLMERLQLIKQTPESLTQYFDQLSTLLEKIQHVEFVAECCLKVIAPDLRMIQYLFNYASKRLRECPVKTPEILNLMDDVTKSKITLGTYIQVNEDSNSAENWLLFCTSNPIMICRNYLLKGEIQKAIIVCRRHEERIRHELPTGVGIELIEQIPSSVDVESLLKWLRVYIPVLLRAHPSLLEVLVKWIVGRTKALELEKNSVWPEQGLSFVEEILEIFNELPSKDPSLEMHLPFEDNSSYYTSPITSLYAFAREIHRLSVLKNEYSITVDFNDYLNGINKQNGQIDFLNLILNNVSENKISSMISGFLKNYCAENFLERDAVLSAHVIKMVKLSSSWWDIESAWERRAVYFIGHIQTIHHKMEAIEATISNVTVPWSPDICALADEAMKMDHPIAQNIYNLRNKVPMKLIMAKYGLSKGLTDIHSFIQYIIKEKQDNMIEDAIQVVKSGNPKEEFLPYLIYLLDVIEFGEIEDGIHFIKAYLDDDSFVKVIQRTISNLMSLLQTRHVDFQDKAFDAIPVLYSALMSLNYGAASELEADIHTLQSLWTLKNKYKMEVPFSIVYKTKKRRGAILKELLSKMSTPEVSNLTKFVKDAYHIAVLLNLPRELALLELSHLYAVNSNPTLCIYFTKLLLDSEDSFIDSYSNKIFEFITDLLNVMLTNGVKLEDDFWKAIRSLLKKIALLLPKADDTVKITNLFSLVTLCSQSKPPTGQNIRSFYAEQIETPPVLPPSSYSRWLINGDSPETAEDVSSFHNDIEKTIKLMPHNLTSIHRLQTVLWTLVPKEDVPVLKKLLEIVKEKVFNVLGRVVLSRNLDLELALVLLFLVPFESGMEWLQKYLSSRRDNWGHLKDRAAVALVGKHYIGLSQHWVDPHLQKSFAEYYLKFGCFLRLQKFGIPPKVADTYCETHDGKKTLLLKLMTFTGVELHFLHDFCRDLNFSFQECLRLYLEHTLLNWKPQYEESVNPETGKSELLILSKIEDLARKCSQIEGLSTSKDELIDYLKKIILPRVNFYYYEVFIVIIDTILKLCPTHQEFFRQHLLLLSFLKSYRRISPVSNEETDLWFHFFPDQSGVPQISKYRLPFAPLPSDPWKIIKPELSLKTYKLWLNAPMWLNVSLEKDVICSFTIMNLKGEVTNNSNTEWNLHLQYKSLMSDIAECISKMQNIETAVAASYCVVNYIMPPGADRVDAAQRCYFKAKEWVSIERSESAKIGLIKAEKKYLSVSTYNTLYKYQLARPEYLALVHQPTSLISALYTDPSIVTRTTDLSSSHPDINKAVMRIATHHDIKLVVVLKELLTEWLQSNSSLNSSFENINIFPTSSTYSDNIIRTCYVLNGFKDLSILENTIMSYAFPQDTSSISAGVRLRALQCLRATKTNKELEQLAIMDLSSIRELMLSLEFISDLERFALDYTVQEFDNCNKEEVVESLLKRACPEAIILSAKIAITYHVWLPLIWNSVLSSMTSLKMDKVLEYCLPELNHIANQLDELIFKDAWECLLLTSISKVRSGRKETEKYIEKTFGLIEACPIVSNLDLHRIIRIYQELKYPELAEFLSKFT